MLKGEKTLNGTGKVLKSTEKDNVFVYFADHGAKVDLKKQKIKIFLKNTGTSVFKQFPILYVMVQYFCVKLNDFFFHFPYINIIHEVPYRTLK